MSEQTQLTQRPVSTEFVYPPIPSRSWDWMAHFSSDSEDIDDEGRGTMMKGWGRTEAEAIQDLLDRWEEKQAEAEEDPS